MNNKFKIAALALVLSAGVGMASDVDAAVPRDSVKYRNHYYKVYNRSLNWHAAKKFCEDIGGHLATVMSSSEQDFLSDLVAETGTKNCYWLGGHKSRGVWHWVTNETPTYANWAKDQPDNFTGAEDCVMMYRKRNPASDSSLGQWKDISWDGDCYGERFFGVGNFGFICEWNSWEDHSRRHSYRDEDYYDDDDDYYDDRDDRDDHGGYIERRNRRDVWR